MAHTAECALLDVDKYPSDFILICDDHVKVRVTYKKVWDDEFCARGWKLNAAIGDSEIIASTRETGQRINTSVFIHDILDHFLSGFGVSGHRSEAMALIQLFKRTGSDPRPDYEQMVKEDIINGRVNGEGLVTFLPKDLYLLLPLNVDMSDKEVIDFLHNKVGERRLIDSLVENFFDLGRSGTKHADDSWKRLGLNENKRTEIGLALQDALNRVDHMVEESGVEFVKGDISISNMKCTFNIQGSSLQNIIYGADVA